MNSILIDRLSTRIEQETGITYLVITIPEVQNLILYNYQVEMIFHNPRASIIPFEVRRKNGNIEVYYGVTGKSNLVQYLKNKRLTKKEFVSLLYDIAKNIIEGKSLLLYEKSFICSDELIYIDPEGKELSMLYLPINVSACFELKDFVLRLITKTAFIQIQEGDNYLQRIIEYVKSNNFSTGDFMNLLKSFMNDELDVLMKNNSTSGPKPPINENFPRTEQFQLPNTQEGQHSSKMLLYQALKLPWGQLHGKNLPVVILYQLIIVIFAFASDYLMNGLGVQSDSRYIAIAAAVLVLNLLLFKYLANKKKAPDIKPKISAQISAGTPESPAKSGSFPAVKNLIDETVLLYVNKDKPAFLESGKCGDIKKRAIGRYGYIIGRSPEVADLVIPEKSIGRVQAEIVFRNGGYYIIDKNSQNGTYINDVRLDGGVEYLLNDGDNIIFANIPYKFILQ